MVVPVAIALILFFGALSWATSHVNAVNQQVDLALALLRVADSFAQPGVVTESSFDQSCSAVKGSETSVNFAVCLVSPDNLANYLKGISSGSSGGSCVKKCYTASIPRRLPGMITNYFPVSYQVSSGSLPENDVYFLVVTVWPRA